MTRGKIVLIPFPFTDLSGEKIRPAVILFSDKKSNDVIVSFISSKHKLINTKLNQVVLPNPRNGLKVKSLIRLDKLATLDKKIILGEIGSVGDEILGKLLVKLGDMFRV